MLVTMSMRNLEMKKKHPQRVEQLPLEVERNLRLFLEKRPLFKKLKFKIAFPKKTERCHLNKQLMLS